MTKSPAAVKRSKYGRFFCSPQCSTIFYQEHKDLFVHGPAPTKNVVSCEYCGGETTKHQSVLSRNKHVFCSHRCSILFGPDYKQPGNQRSKLELWLEEQLGELYPDVQFEFNSRDEINAELDIYIPSLKLAFELNGPFHYEPIHGQERLAATTNNDKRKVIACYEQGIELCVIDTSHQKKMTPKNSQPFLDIITSIIAQRL